MKAELVIMAKQPVAGKVKTRLTPDYSEHEAARIAAVLLRETVALSVKYWPGPVVLSIAPDCRHELVAELCELHSLACRAQCEGDLGTRMRHELGTAINNQGCGIVIGTDVPEVLYEVLPQAWKALQHNDVVIGASEDGGYYLLGMARLLEGLFQDIPWSTDQVYDQTLEQVQAAGSSYVVLPMARDIDTAKDLRIVAARFPLLRQFID
jgi:rSAM/selenodomain-associated transferase 1